MNENHVRTTPTSKEIGLFKNFFNEAAFMGGTHVRYLSVFSKEITQVSSEKYTWDGAIEMDIIYDERPKVSLLKRLNWYTEDSEIQPRIMYIPSKLVIDNKPVQIVVKRGDLVQVPNPVNGEEDDIFQVSEVRTELVSLMWICNMVPFRKNLESSSEPTVNNKWLKT